MARMPSDQSPRKKTSGDRPGEQEPDHRRQAEDDDEHAADHEDEPANVAGDFRGGEVDLRRAPLRFGRSRNVGRMPVVPRVNHERDQRAGRREDRDPGAKHETDNGEQRDDDRADRETRDGIGKRDSAAMACRGCPGQKRGDERQCPERPVSSPLRAQTLEAA